MLKADEALQEPFLEWSTGLYDECVRARIALLSGVPGLIVEKKDDSTMAISGEPMYWSNSLFITSEIAGNSVVDSFVEKVTRRGLPSTIVCKKELTSQIQSVVEGAGYIRTADTVLMTLVAKSDFPHGKGCRLRKLTDTSMNDALAEIIGRGTGAPKDAVNRLVAPSIAGKNIEVFIALRDALPVATATTTIRDSTVGIWRMVTAPEYQRQGIGQVFLAQIINLYRERNLHQFYLIANSIGRRLYEKLGFVAIGDLAQWVL